jgi:hypothetical protein
MTDELINFTEKRNEAIEQRRRDFERILFQNFLGVYTVLDDEGNITPIELIDVSDKGCLIQILSTKENLEKMLKKVDLDIRIYFTEKAFIPASLSIKYQTDFINEHGLEYRKFGCEFDKQNSSFEAIESFVNFLYKFAKHATVDRNDTKILRL